MKKLLFVFVFLTSIIACDSTSQLEEEIAKIPVNIELDRFDEVFANATPQDISDLKAKYPQFLPKQVADSVFAGVMNDTLQQQLNREVLKTFPEVDYIISDLGSLFQHIKYYYPQFAIPKIYTVTSDVDYRTKVLEVDQMLMLQLDNYLGSDHKFYINIDQYTAANMRKEMLISDVTTLYGKRFIDVPKKRNFMAQMIYFGKELYIKDVWLPNESDHIKIGYSASQMEWANTNEEFIWRYFVEKEFLYATENKLNSRFISPAPFSKFNLELDNESPGMIGRYIGWQIVRSYMNNNDVTLQELMGLDPDYIYKNSKYKPRK